METNFLKLLILLCVLEIVSWYLLKQYASISDSFCYQNKFCFGIIIVTFMAMPIVLAQIIKTKNISIFNAFWNIITTSLTLCLGLLVFNEKITLKQLIGIIIGIVSMVLII